MFAAILAGEEDRDLSHTTETLTQNQKRYGGVMSVQVTLLAKFQV